MDLKKKAKEIIGMLESRGFYAECPCCGETILLAKAGLFYLDDFTPKAFELHQQLVSDMKERAQDLREERANISSKSEVGAKSVNIGFILERLAPSMHSFRFNRNDCRSLFDPIDYIIFEGLSKTGRVDRIIFSDIKTGKAGLQKKQRNIKALIEEKKVEWDLYKGDE